MSDVEQNVDEHLEALDAKETEFTQKCLFRSATRVASEIRRVAKAEKRLIPYLHGTFTVMNNATDLLEPESGLDASIEIIGLLESEDRARSIQPDLPEWEYEQNVNWLLPCGYDNLAKATAAMNGYNSEGIHACIADGIQVCRQTGKLQCITCFREYATDVYRAADDSDMAMHYARVGIAHEDPGPHDRRWAGCKDLTQGLLRTGQLKAAIDGVEQARDLCETWHTVSRARLITKMLMLEIAHLLGEPTRWDGSITEDDPPEGEFPWFEMRRDQVNAVAACCQQDYAMAIELLTKWDRELTRRKCLDEWFDTRLRLLASHRLAGNDREFEKLADQLEAKARPARDWLSLRCLKRLRDDSIAVAPIPLVADLDLGLFAAASSTPTAPPDSTDEPAETAEETDATGGVTPPEFVLDFWKRMGQVQLAEQEGEAIDDSTDKILDDMLAFDTPGGHGVEHARWLLNTTRFAIGDGERGREVWAWAEKLLAPFRQDAVMLNLFATLGSALRFGPNEELEDLVSEEQLESMFRESLDLDPDHARNFARAGDYFRFMENLGEAERCYSRGFRLDRSNSEVAKELARIYRRTERERDALNVLDMALREGTDDPDLSWTAALSAHQIGQFEATLTYLDAYEKLAPEQAWVNYYRASALLELQRPDEALAAAEQEAIRNPECPFHVAIHRAIAAASLHTGKHFRDRLADVLAIPLSEVDYLTPNGLNDLFAKLWSRVAELDESDELRLQLKDRILAGGLGPDELFATYREAGEAVDDVNFYQCVLRQPLDDRWADWHGRLPHEADLKSYEVTWGVLALSEDDAVATVLAWQENAYPLAAEIIDVELADEGYRERIGVVWQGYREGDEGAS